MKMQLILLQMFVRIDVCDVMCDVMCEQRYIIMRLIISLSVCDVCVCACVCIYFMCCPHMESV